MKFWSTNLLFYGKTRIPQVMMKTFIFFFCTSLLAFSPGRGFSQDALIRIDREQTITIEGIFKLVRSQTDYRFVYSNDQVKDAPYVHLEQGLIRAGDLLKKGLAPARLTYVFNNNTIILRKSEDQDTFTVTGVVRDKDGVPLPGITVYTTDFVPTAEIDKDYIVRGTATDIDGRFTIKVAVNEYLTAVGLGYEPNYFQVTSADKTNFEITLQQAVDELNEVVVVGYGTTKRKDLTGSVGSVESKEITQIKSQTIDQAIIGQIPGVFVNAQSGGPGSGALVNIRGLSQIIGDNQPLYVVDGVPIVINPRFSNVGSIGAFGDRENPLLAINPNDVERVDVLKDASAAAIYGSRAANGVILITTKRGKRNTPTRFNFTVNSAIQNPLNRYDVLNANEWKQFITDQGLDAAVEFGDADTDWQDEIIQNNALWNEYGLNISGGTEKVNFLVSGRITDQEGIMKGNNFTRYNFTSNLDADITKRLKAGFNISYNYSINKQSGLISLANGAFYRPDLPVFNEDGTYSTSVDNYGFTVRNPIGDQGNIRNKAISQNLLGSAYGQYEIIEGLNFRSQLSLALRNDRSSTFSPSYTSAAQFGQFFGTSGALLDVQHTAEVNSSWSNTLNFNKTIANDHNIDAVVGVSWDRLRIDLESQGYDGFPDDEVLTNINSANNVNNWASDANENALNSLFGRVNYNYKDRYLATFTGRYDGSIKFGPDNQFGFFPSAALAWNIHNENFLANNDAINQLKLRASLGRTGSDNLPAFTFLPNYASLGNGNSFYNGVNGIVVEGVPNSEIRWEETDQLDLGLEFALFNSRIRSEVVYFEKKTSDIILLVPIAAQTGSQNWNANVADVTNKGWEITLGGDIVRNQNFRWNSSFNISFVDNNVDNLNGGSTTAFGSAGIMEGQPIGVMLGYDVESIAQSQDEIDALNAGAPDGNYFNLLMQPGDYIFRDVDGDGEITVDDRVPLGDINPEFFGGWNNTISYKNFDFSFNFNFVEGNEKFWTEGAIEYVLPSPNKNYLRSTLTDLWTPENTDAQYARFSSFTHGYNTPNSKAVYDGSYIKLRSASIGFNFPNEWLKDTGVQNARLSLTGNNLFVITDYPGLDPESVDSQRGGATVDLIRNNGFSYPQARTIVIGLNVSL